MTIGDEDITGLVLAGGRGSRMGGVDKGLQNHQGVPLALHALLRLQPQVGEVMINANRNLGAYESMGVPVWPDAQGRLPRPAGRRAGRPRALRNAVSRDGAVRHAELPARPGGAARARRSKPKRADIAMAATREHGEVMAQPVFCLLKAELLESLVKYLQSGQRKIDRWTAQHRVATVVFDDAAAFDNANTLEELQRLQR